ncbi:MAG: ACP S-malonyltransferase [Solirubrobacteraceae bacterium]|jgi:[acyl-carrier-protein] S-malonyltransferase
MAGAALIFPGQGSHSEGMADEFRNTPTIERGLALLDYDPFERIAEGTRYQQPAVFLVSVAQWERERPDAIVAAGHSLGEYAALVAAGALDFEPALELVDERASAMAAAAALTPSGMTVMLKGDPAAVTQLAASLDLIVANDNSPGQLVLAGPVSALEQAEQRAKDEAGARAQRLAVSGAFHSPLMAPAAARLRAALARTAFREPRIPVYSNSSVAPFVDPQRELAENLLRPVRWRETLLAFHDLGVEDYIELGPGQILTGLVKRTVPQP